MGPYSEETQNKRRANLQIVLSNPHLSEDMRRIWKTHLQNLAVNEDEYNSRVRKFFQNAKPITTL